MNRQFITRHFKKVIACLVLALLSLMFLSLIHGTSSMSYGQIWAGLWEGNNSLISTIILEMRLPRILLAAAVGMGLSASGVLMQAIFNNSMASPYVMGLSSGASLGIIVAVIVGLDVLLGAMALPIGAFLGVLFISGVILFLSKRKTMTPSFLLLIGLTLGIVCEGISGILIFLGSNSTGMDATVYWLMGTISFTKLSGAVITSTIVLLCIAILLPQYRVLNCMQEGAEVAKTLGIHLDRYIRFYLLLNALLVGIIVMYAGVIGFIGLLVPHGVRLLCGANHRLLLPLSILVGGIVVVLADALGRSLVAGVDIPLGVMVSLIGGPLFIGMIIKTIHRL